MPGAAMLLDVSDRRQIASERTPRMNHQRLGSPVCLQTGEAKPNGGFCERLAFPEDLDSLRSPGCKQPGLPTAAVTPLTPPSVISVPSMASLSDLTIAPTPTHKGQG